MELTPKQQVVELIRQAQKILLITSREPNNDQLASVVALQLALAKQGKQVQAVISDKMPRIAQLFADETKQISRNLTGVRDFVVTLSTHNVEVNQLKWHRDVDAKKLNIVVTPHSGNFEPRDATFSHGAFQFDLVIALGVPNFDKIDRLIDDNPTVFDGLHVANIDYHRINNNWGSVNLIDQLASSTAEMLVSVLESLEQSIIDADIATALLAGIMAATNRFTAASTTPKAMTVAAQLLAAGARQQDVVRMLYDGNGSNGDQPSRESHSSQDGRKKNHSNQPQPSQQPQHQSTQPSRSLNTARPNHSSSTSPKPTISPANRPDHSAARSVAHQPQNPPHNPPQQIQNQAQAVQTPAASTPAPSDNSQTPDSTEHNSYGRVQTFDSADQPVSV